MKRITESVLLLVVCASLVLIFLSGSGWIEPVKAKMQASQVNKSWLLAAPDKALLHSGDIIFRHGRGFISNAFLKFSLKDPRYSHAGIIEIENGNIFVYHCIGGEENKSNKMKKESLAEFCRADRIHSFGIFRTDLGKEALAKIRNEVQAFYSNGLEFDTDFDLRSDNKMYCTEMVYKLLQDASGDKNYIPLTHVSGRTFVSCDNIYLSHHCTGIYSYNYQNLSSNLRQ
ncbi:MAG: YiiX/YebB-like N1pC/P60 family cysteine hydrolase [Bacteroidia bacterium]